MSEAFLNKYDCLARAKMLLASGDDASLRYASLELRFCIEAVTYEKLRAYATRLPPNVLSRWQPPQAVVALLDLEEEADEEYTVAVGIRRGETTGPLEVIGEHRTFTPAWLRKHYNKLGSFLHVPNENVPGQSQLQVDSQELRQYLESVVAECERVIESSVTSTIARLVDFNCQLCHRKTVANAEGAKRRGRVSCLHLGCEAEHIVFVDKDGSMFFRLNGWEFPCLSCGHKHSLSVKVLTPRYEFACDACGRRHKLIDKVWRYTDEFESDGNAS